MRAEVQHIEANDIPTWPDWLPACEADEHQWFIVSIGAVGRPGADLFQVAVATSRWFRRARRHGRFVGLVVDRFEPRIVEQAIRDFVAGIEGHGWEDIAAQLSDRMEWEYKEYNGPVK